MQDSLKNKIVLRIQNLKDPETLKEIKDEYPWIPTPKKYVWENTSGELLTRALLSPELASLTEEIDQYLDARLVEQASNKLTELYTKAADTVLKVKKPRKLGKHPYKHKQKPKKWYDNECRNLKNNCRRWAIRKMQNPIDTENRKIPARVKLRIYFFCRALKCELRPIKKRKNAW